MAVFTPSPLTLGTVQLGLTYGIANGSGLPSEGEACAVLDAATDGGITTLDTARAYGVSEERIGRWLAGRTDPATAPHIVTKIPAVPDGTAADKQAFVAAALDASAATLGRRPLDLVLVHRGADLLDASVRGSLEAARDAGVIGGFGASVYEPVMAERLLREVEISALQAPISLVDRRLATSGVLTEAARRGILVFARSVFLQGALLLDPDRLPPHLAPLAAVRRSLSEFDMPIATLALLGVRDLTGVSSVLVGVERAEQLIPHLAALQLPRLSQTVLGEIAAIAGSLPERVIDPSRWPKA